LLLLLLPLPVYVPQHLLLAFHQQPLALHHLSAQKHNAQRTQRLAQHSIPPWALNAMPGNTTDEP
jgi:hypothetical protein